jgi:hypothetical protein
VYGPYSCKAVAVCIPGAVPVGTTHMYIYSSFAEKYILVQVVSRFRDLIGEDDRTQTHHKVRVRLITL